MRTNRLLSTMPVGAFLIAVAALVPMSPQAVGQVCVQYPTMNVLNPITVSGKFPDGSVIAASGNALVVGIEFNADLGNGVWVMRKQAAEWIIEQKIYAPPGAGDFGTALALDGEVAVIGAESESNGKGAAYVFRFDGKTWNQEAKLVAPDAAFNDKFGQRTAISGDLMIVGAPYEDEGVMQGQDHGAAYTFHFDGSAWQFEQKIVPDGIPYNSFFPRRIALSGDEAALNTGKEVYVYQHDGSQWIQQQQITASLGFTLGGGLVLEDNQIFVGGGSGAGPGSVFVYKFDGKSWVQAQQLTAFDATSQSDGFGAVIARQDGIVVVGAPWKVLYIPNYTSGYSGAAYVYQPINETWQCTLKLMPSSFPSDYAAQLGQNIASIDDGFALGMRGVFWTNQYGTVVEFETLLDCDKSGTPDSCDIPDCNGNRVPDVCDFAEGASADCNGNSIPDECETQLAYSVDDGVSEVSWGVMGGGSNTLDFVWMNQLSVLPGHETIDLLGIVWGNFYRSGLPVTLLLYDDPNCDGNPTDAVLLASTEVITKDGGTGGDDVTQFEYVRIPPTYVGPPGHGFFIAAKAACWNAICYPATADSTAPAKTNSWGIVATTPIDLEHPGSNYLNLQQIPDNFMLRAGTFDCNGNGTWDQCDITTGFSLDLNNNGIPDECDGSCIADLAPDTKGNGVVDVDDLLELINAWGACEPKQPCPADIAPPGKPNSTVDVDDLLELINNWGPCT